MNTSIRTIVVDDLGWKHALVEIEGEMVLFVDALTSWEDRIEAMSSLVVDGTDSW